MGISPRTFFRYFPSKSDVLWVESPAELARFQAELDAAGPDEPYQESLLPAVRAAFTWNPADEQWARDRAQLVLTEPAAQAQLFVVLSRWRRAAAEHVRQQLSGPMPRRRRWSVTRSSPACWRHTSGGCPSRAATWIPCSARYWRWRCLRCANTEARQRWDLP